MAALTGRTAATKSTVGGRLFSGRVKGMTVHSEIAPCADGN